MWSCHYKILYVTEICFWKIYRKVQRCLFNNKIISAELGFSLFLFFITTPPAFHTAQKQLAYPPDYRERKGFPCHYFFIFPNCLGGSNNNNNNNNEMFHSGSHISVRLVVSKAAHLWLNHTDSFSFPLMDLKVKRWKIYRLKVSF